jgi:ATP-dependent Lon protease
MKTENIKSLIIGFLLLIIFFQYKSCNSEKTEIVEIPEIKGKFEAVKPKHSAIELTDHIVDVNKKVLGKKVNAKASDYLQKEYDFSKKEIERMAKEIAEIEALADSLAFSEYLAIEEKNKLVELLKQCNKLNEFCQDFNDENIIANVSGIVFKNEVQKLKLDYTIKPRQIEKAVMKGLFVGGEFGSNKDLDQFTYKIDLEYLYKNKIYKTAYQRFGNEDFFLVGGSVKLF